MLVGASQQNNYKPGIHLVMPVSLLGAQSNKCGKKKKKRSLREMIRYGKGLISHRCNLDLY